MELETSAQKLVIAKKTLDEADSKLKRLEEKRQAIEELKRKEARLHSDAVNTGRTLASLTERIQGKKTILDNLHQRQVSIDTQAKLCLGKLEQAGLPTDQPAQSLHTCLASFDDKISGLRADQEATSRDLQTDKKRAVSLAQENKCPLCIQPLDGEYKTNLLSRIEKDNFDREKTLIQLRTQIDSMQKTKASASDAYANLQTCLTRAEELKNRLSEEEINLKNLSCEFEEKQGLEADMKMQLEQVQFEIGRFDSSELDAARAQREVAFRQYYVVDSELRTKESRKSDLFRRLDEIKERIDVAQDKAGAYGEKPQNRGGFGRYPRCLPQHSA